MLSSTTTTGLGAALAAGLLVAACSGDGTVGDDDDRAAATATSGSGASAGTGPAGPAGSGPSVGPAGVGGATTGGVGSSSASGAGVGGAGVGGAGVGGAGVGGAGVASAGVGGMGSTGSFSSSSTSASSSSSTGSGGGPLTYDACGFPNDGPWMEIDYGSAYTVTNPAFSYSNTPGFGEPQWTPNGHNWPEVWFLGGGSNQVSNDPIGKIASVSPGKKLQMMIGLSTVSSYSYASVCVEGRSVSTSASVLFDVYNPKNNCGASGQMSHSWAIHATGVNIGQCLIPGDGFQAVRLEPYGGSSHLGVRRVRVTLHGAIY